MPRRIPAGKGLKLSKHLSLVKDTAEAVAELAEGTVAADVQKNVPPCPKAIAEDDNLKELWDAIIPELYEAGMTSRIDWPALEMMIRHFYAARLASDDLFLGEPTVWDEKNQRPMKNPSEVVFRSESLAFMAYAREIGMTFASRTRLPSQLDQSGAADNPFMTG